MDTEQTLCNSTKRSPSVAAGMHGTISVLINAGLASVTTERVIAGERAMDGDGLRVQFCPQTPCRPRIATSAQEIDRSSLAARDLARPFRAPLKN
jgi:hypothetical protein